MSVPLLTQCSEVLTGHVKTQTADCADHADCADYMYADWESFNIIPISFTIVC